jgi:hypothetical protein
LGGGGGEGENRAVYEIMWKNMVQPDRPQITIWCMHIGCWIPKATNTNLEYIIIPFHGNSCWKKAPRCHFISTLIVLHINRIFISLVQKSNPLISILNKKNHITLPYCISLRPILILSFHLASGLFPSGFFYQKFRGMILSFVACHASS